MVFSAPACVECSTVDEGMQLFLKAAAIVKPLLIVSEHELDLVSDLRLASRCWPVLCEGLTALGYEFRVTTIQLLDEEPLAPREQLILLASRIGLPDLPGEATLFSNFLRLGRYDKAPVTHSIFGEQGHTPSEESEGYAKQTLGLRRPVRKTFASSVVTHFETILERVSYFLGIHESESMKRKHDKVEDDPRKRLRSNS
jgi:hypothetical protein